MFFKSVLFNIQLFGYFLDIFLILIDDLIPQWSEDILCMTSVILYFFRLILWPCIWLYLVKYSVCAWKTVCSAVLGLSVPQKSIWLNGLILLFKYILWICWLLFFNSYWKNGFEISNYNCGFVYFSLQFYHFLHCGFWSTVVFFWLPKYLNYSVSLINCPVSSL